ncbi:MAG: putative transcriptional regulator [Chlamydiales bacterium]|jgi:DNA-binding transcriptional LysR family regulator|nr:putative transcriptional regulator [Chlamydiales bacterium]
MADLTQMRSLLLVVQKGSLAAAARELNVTAAAISKQLNKLEAELGLSLLTRSTRHVQLTDVGKIYCEQCRRIFEEVDALDSLVLKTKAVPQGLLRVVSGRHFAMSHITPHLQEFLSAYPAIHLELELAERVPDLLQEGIDVQIGMSVSAIGDVIQRRIATTRYCFCVSPAYLKKWGYLDKLEDVLKHRYISHSRRRLEEEIPVPFSAKEPFIPYLRVNDTETLLQLAKEGLGIIKVHRYAALPLMEQGDLIELFPSESLPEIALYVAFPKRRHLPSKVRTFIDFIEEKIKAKGPFI